VNVIGAGRVGKTLGKLLHHHIQSICNQSLASSQAACDFIGAGRAVAHLSDLPPADITLIAVPDKAIASVCEAWVKSTNPQPGSIVFHVSGALSASALQSAQAKGLYTASIHPLKSFADSDQAYKTFKGTFCGMEGDVQALDRLAPLFESLGAELGVIDSDSKALYHAACVMACGGLTALYATCQQLLKTAGMPEAQLGEYMKQTIDNNVKLGSSAALTGPVARGDEDTVKAHEAVLSGDVLKLYRVLTGLQRAVIASAEREAIQE